MRRHQQARSDNPYVKEAHAFLKEDGDDLFVISVMELAMDYDVPQDPAFLHNKKLNVKVKRLAGWQEGRSLRVMYHAETPEQAKGILGMMLKGKGYYFWEIFPVNFEHVTEPLPEKFETLAQDSIKKYRDRPSYPIRQRA
jgi:hypothetical protein